MLRFTVVSSSACDFINQLIDYVTRRTAEGMPKREIIRCLKRYLAREVFNLVMHDHRARKAPPSTA